MRLYVASESDILSGKVTDIYFIRTKEVLIKKGLSDVEVRLEFHVNGVPKGYDWVVYVGLEEALKILSQRPVNVYSLPEGTILPPNSSIPIMVVEGRYVDFVELETAVLGILRHSSSVATKAARIKRLGMGNKFIFFGLRSAYPALAPMLDRSAYIGGFDGVSGILSEEFLGIKPSGTMPHSLIVVFGDNVEAWKAFDEVIPEEVPRIALVDTFEDERMEAVKAANALGKKLFGVRLDTPSSRRGNFREIIKEVRWTLDLLGYKHVKIVASGGINERSVHQLRDVVDIFGVGTSVATPPPVDVGADIVEVKKGSDWTPISKRGKLPGSKKLYRCSTLEYEVVPWNSTPERCFNQALKLYLDKGKLVEKLPTPQEIREYVLRQLKEIPEPTPID
ncbi:MAG: nicotinate phosphoribosyltransferase [Sulfolobales archaeon]|nr:nicotinate phosphoribosyltransferase [Sulfolobales archaeon]MCX8186773.1 nicotinate phosphoribosyltransferase [Sulfolobales archaeon]MDW7969894.1 nicotinate phosphoribosyltransferase [Sulfolobales archaeon]